MGDLAHDPRNTSTDKLKSYVERVFNIEQAFLDAKAERDDSIKDIKAEIKSREEETGVSAKEVIALAKVRLDEAGSIEKQQALNSTMELYESVFGISVQTNDHEEEDDALN